MGNENLKGVEVKFEVVKEKKLALENQSISLGRMIEFLVSKITETEDKMRTLVKQGKSEEQVEELKCELKDMEDRREGLEGRLEKIRQQIRCVDDIIKEKENNTKQEELMPNMRQKLMDVDSGRTCENVNGMNLSDMFLEEDKTENPTYILRQSCESGDVQELRKVLVAVEESSLENLDVNIVFDDLDEYTPLCLACSNNHEDIVRELLFHPKIDVSKCDPSSKTTNESIHKMLQNHEPGTYKTWRENRIHEGHDLVAIDQKLQEFVKVVLEEKVPFEIEASKFEELEIEELLLREYKYVMGPEYYYDLLSVCAFPHAFDYSSIENDLFLGFTILHSKHQKKFGVVFSKHTSFLRSSPSYRRLYIGEIDSRSGKFDGRGELYDERGRDKVYEGWFGQGKREGKGLEVVYEKEFGAYTTVFEGNFKNGRYHGRGHHYDVKTGKVTHGYWVCGSLDETRVVTYDCPEIEYSKVSKFLQDRNKLGGGAYGDVYEMKTSDLLKNLESSMKKSLLERTIGEKVAVKIIPCAEYVYHRMIYGMTRRGIGLCYSFSSRHVLETYCIIHGKKHVGYVMKLCDRSVGDVIAKLRTGRSSLSVDEKKRILHETALGMKSLHSRHVMHRDLKWDNVMADCDGTIKLTDFDTLKEDTRYWRMGSMPLQSTGIGTPGYIPPEVYRGQKYSLKGDVFAYGLMIYALLWEMSIPYLSQFQCHCGVKMESIAQTTPPFKHLDRHVAECGLRPHIDITVPKEEEEITACGGYPDFLVDMMVQCWDRNPFNRPSFDDICFRFDLEKSKSFRKILIRFPQVEGLFGEQQIMYIIRPYKVEKIVEWIENKFFTKKIKDEEEEEEEEDDVMIKMFVKNEEEETRKHLLDVEKKTKVVCITHSILGKIETDEELEKVLELGGTSPSFDAELENFDKMERSTRDDLFPLFGQSEIPYHEHKKTVNTLKEEIGSRDEIIRKMSEEIGRKEETIQEQAKKIEWLKKKYKHLM